MKIAINKRLCSTESKPKIITLVGGLQNQRVTAEIYLSSAASPLLSNFQIGSQIFQTIFTFQRIFIFRMFKLVLLTFWVPSRGELGAPLRVFPDFRIEYSRTPQESGNLKMVRVSGGFELSVGLSRLCSTNFEQLLAFGANFCSSSNLEKFLPF